MKRTIVIAAALLLAAASPAAAQDVERTVGDPDDVTANDQGEQSDIRAVTLARSGGTLTMTLGLDAAKIFGGYTFLDTDDDGGADFTVSWERSFNGKLGVYQTTVSLMKVASDAGSNCQAVTADAPIDTVESDATEISYKIDATKIGDPATLRFAAIALTQTQNGEVPDFVPDAADDIGKGDRSCQLPNNNFGYKVDMKAGATFPPGLTAAFTTDRSPTAGRPFTLLSTSASDGAITEESWDTNGDGTFGDATGPTAPLTLDAGDTTVSLRVHDDQGAVATATQVISVAGFAAQQELAAPIVQVLLGAEHTTPLTPTGPPEPHFAADAAPPKLGIGKAPKTVKEGAQVTLTATAPPGADIAWDLDGDGERDDAHGPRVAFTPTCTGRQTVTVEATADDGLANATKVNLRVRRGPSPNIARLAARSPRTRKSSLDVGTSLRGWTHTGAFSAQRSKNVPIERELENAGGVGGSYASGTQSVGARGRGWATSWRGGARTSAPAGLTPDATGERSTGVLVSPRFRLTKPQLAYRLGGDGDDRRGCTHDAGVELWVRSSGRFRPVTAGRRDAGDSEAMRTETVKISKKYRGHEAVVVATDESSTGHVNFDGFTQGNAAFGPQPPVIGFANTHDHPDAHQGFGGLAGHRTYMGVPGGAYSDYDPAVVGAATAANNLAADLRDEPTHFAGTLGGLLLPAAHELATNTSLLRPFHEQFHITELHRAWEGGLRLFSSLAVSNEALEYMVSNVQRRGGGAPGGLADNEVPLTPERAVIEAHVAAMRQLARLNSDWMEIAYNPVDARQIIAEGKLAIILGTEVDQSGSLGFGSVDEEVDWLWRLGIRQVTPIHSVDNGLGGAAIFQDVYDYENDLLNRPNRQFAREYIDNDVRDNGIAIQPKPGRTPSFGFFFRTTADRSCSRPGAIQGDCVDYLLDNKQFVFGHDFNIFIGNHPSAELIRGRGAPGMFPLPDKELPEPLFNGGASGLTNTRGLTDAGRAYVSALERRGMLVDLEHASEATINDLLAPPAGGAPGGPAYQFANSGDCAAIAGLLVGASRTPTAADTRCMDHAYPIMSSHTSFREQSLRTDQSANKGNWAREFERKRSELRYIDRAGGIVAPVVLQDPINPWLGFPGTATPRFTTHTNPRTATLNDCAGSSKSWLTAYLFALNNTVNHRVALSTDMALVGGTGPRFKTPGSPIPTNCPAASQAVAGIAQNLPSVPLLIDPQQIIRDALRAQDAEESMDRAQYNHDGQSVQVEYSDRPVPGRSLHPDAPAGIGNIDYNTKGMLTIGQLPDLLQDAVNSGLDPRDLEPLMHSAQAYIDMWGKAFKLNRCLDDRGRPTRTFGACAGPDEPAPLDEAAVCRNTCPQDAGRGHALDPAGRPLQWTRPVPAIAVPAAP